MFYIGIACSILAGICFIGEFMHNWHKEKEEADKANRQWLLLLIAALICFK